MEEYESVTEEYNNNYEEHNKEMPGRSEDFGFVETITITRIEA